MLLPQASITQLESVFQRFVADMLATTSYDLHDLDRTPDLHFRVAKTFPLTPTNLPSSFIGFVLNVLDPRWYRWTRFENLVYLSISKGPHRGDERWSFSRSRSGTRLGTFVTRIPMSVFDSIDFGSRANRCRINPDQGATFDRISPVIPGIIAFSVDKRDQCSGHPKYRRRAIGNRMNPEQGAVIDRTAPAISRILWCHGSRPAAWLRLRLRHWYQRPCSRPSSSASFWFVVEGYVIRRPSAPDIENPRPRRCWIRVERVRDLDDADRQMPAICAVVADGIRRGDPLGPPHAHCCLARFEPVSTVTRSTPPFRRFGVAICVETFYLFTAVSTPPAACYNGEFYRHHRNYLSNSNRVAASSRALWSPSSQHC